MRKLRNAVEAMILIMSIPAALFFVVMVAGWLLGDEVNNRNASVVAMSLWIMAKADRITDKAKATSD